MLHMKSVMKTVSESLSPTLQHPVSGHENLQQLQLAFLFSGIDLEFLGIC